MGLVARNADLDGRAPNSLSINLAGALTPARTATGFPPRLTTSPDGVTELSAERSTSWQGIHITLFDISAIALPARAWLKPCWPSRPSNLVVRHGVSSTSGMCWATSRPARLKPAAHGVFLKISTGLRYEATSMTSDAATVDARSNAHAVACTAERSDKRGMIVVPSIANYFSGSLRPSGTVT
ncbi:MAG: hypothetical protein ABW213_01150 [Tardiphaga sp.]